MGTCPMKILKTSSITQQSNESSVTCSSINNLDRVFKR